MNVSGTPPNRASVDLRTSPQDPCPPPTVWRDLMTDVTGHTTGARAAALLSHASRCSLCSPLLAKAIANSNGISTEEEMVWLEGLPSSTPDGQHRLAEAMQRVASGEPRPARGSSLQKPAGSWRWFGWQSLTLGATGLAVVCIALWFATRGPSDAQLLAGAYDQQRLTELRIGQGHSVALYSPTRGAEGNAPSNSQLLKIKLRTEQRMEANPNDATVRQTLGRIALVEHDGSAAVRDFEMAQALSPQLPGLNRDLASAYFEMAETTGQATDYARSIDFFGKHLKDVGGKDPGALFNRGLAWERTSVYTEAIKDYEAALAQEKDGGWRAEIERHLQAVRAHSSEYGHPEPPNTALTPASLLAMKAEAPGDYELYLYVASRQWLPRRGQDAESAAALQKLAEWGRGHQDNWLSDMLRVTPTPRESDAEFVLAKALDASNSGNADAGLEAATAASSLFKALGNKAGLARANSEIVYSLHRGGHSADCLKRADDLQQAHALDAYSALRLYVELEVSSCLAMQKDHLGSIASTNKAALSAQQAGLSISRLRALAFAVEMYNNLDESALAWKIGVQGLAEGEQIRPAVLRRYSLLFGLKEVATKLGLAWTTVGLADAAATSAQRADNLQIRAYALEQLGLNQAQVGQESEAVKTFASADGVLSKLSDSPAKEHYLVDWNTDRAPFRARHPQDLPAVLSEFERGERSYQAIDAYFTRFAFYTEYGDLLLKANRTNDALAKEWYAVQQSEIMQSKSLTDSAKQGAAEIGSPAYLGVVRAYLQQGKPEEALRTWMWFQAASWRPAANTSVPPQELYQQLPPLPVAEAGRLTLIFARVKDGYVAWALNSGKLVRFQKIARPVEEIETRGATLLRLCADPKSSQQDIAILGEGLYTDLIAPFADLVHQANVVQFDLDPALATLPFAALQHGGHYMGLEKPLLFYSAGWSVADPVLRQAITEQERLPSAARLLVLRQAQPAGQAIIPGAYDESKEVAKTFAHSDQRQASVWRSGTNLLLAGDDGLKSALSGADLLHYTGHGLNASGDSTLKPAGAFALATHTFPHCRLAVLAACESFHERENPGNDVPSFARILLRAGASHVLATQWDVDSRSTRELMVRFYAELSDRQPSPQALLRAQQSLHDHASSAHPYYWSPFQIVAQ